MHAELTRLPVNMMPRLELNDLCDAASVSKPAACDSCVDMNARLLPYRPGVP